jgi:membrane-associated phospholipid phosphatase
VIPDWLRSATATDRVVLAYDLALVPIVLLAQPTVAGWQALLAFHLALPPAVLWLAARAARPEASGLTRFLHRWYPMLLLLVLYPEAGLLRHVFFDHDLDPALARLDGRLFPGEPHLWGPRHLPVGVLEAAHAVYFSYYLLLFVPALAAARRAPRAAKQYVYAVVTSLLVHYLFAIAVPTSGPFAERAASMPRGWLFLPLMGGIYTGFDRGGLAFPSTHAAAGLLAALFAARLYPRHRAWCLAWGAAVVVSTVVCGYHYTIDTVAGVGTGLASYWLWGREPRAAVSARAQPAVTTRSAKAAP